MYSISWTLIVISFSALLLIISKRDFRHKKMIQYFGVFAIFFIPTLAILGYFD